MARLRWTVFTALLFTTTALLGCGSDPGYEHTYTTRAVVVSLPGEKAYEDFLAHHETIPDYVSINGSIGMNQMVMPFPVPDDAMLQGIAVGDKVEIVFGERFEPDHKMGMISIKKLPSETVLELGKAEKPGQDRRTGAANEDALDTE